MNKHLLHNYINTNQDGEKDRLNQHPLLENRIFVKFQT